MVRALNIKFLWILTFLLVLIFPQKLFSKTKQTIKLGVLLPFTGYLSEIAKTNLEGIQLAVEEINKLEKLKHADNYNYYEIVLGDTKADPALGNLEMYRLAKEGVLVVLGAYQSSVTYSTTAIAEKLKIPYFIPAALVDNITERDFNYVFRIVCKLSDYAKTQFLFLKDNDLLNTPSRARVALVHEDSYFGQMASNAQKKFSKQFNVNIVLDISYSATRNDLDDVVNQLIAANPSIVLLTSYLHDSALLSRTMYRKKYTSPLILATGAGPKDPMFLKLSQNTAENWFVINEWSSDMKKKGMDEFRKKFNNRFKHDPDGIAVMNYVSTWTIKEAIDHSDRKSREQIQKALKQIVMKNHASNLLPLGRVALDESGNGEFVPIVTQIIDGKYWTVWPKALSSRKPEL